MMRELKEILGLLEGGFAGLKVLVVGDLMLDRYILGEVDRISPEAPVPVLRHAQRYERPGGAANVAMNLAGLGCQTLLAGFWGSDTEQRELAALLEAAKVDTAGVVSSALPTTSKTRILGRMQQLLRLDIESNELPSAVEQQRLLERVEQLVTKVHAVVLSDYAKGALSAALCEAAIRGARRGGIPVLVDPKSKDLSKYSGATVVCPNVKDLVAATGVAAASMEELLVAGEAQRREHDFKYLALTMSEKGIRVLGEGMMYHSPATAREVYDVSGAGDTVIATMAACLAGGLGIESAVELANVAAGVVVGKVGTAAITAAELIAACGMGAREKILDEPRLEKRLAEWRAAGETVVFTNGCFDVLHVGHVTMLEACRRLGSKVVVGLNTDASVRRLKGEGRPVFAEGDRAKVLAALAAVDAVVLFGEETPLELIQWVMPDVLVKGGDYVAENVVGYSEVIGWGGRMEIVPLVEGVSTTDTVETIRARGL